MVVAQERGRWGLETEMIRGENEKSSGCEKPHKVVGNLLLVPMNLKSHENSAWG